MDEFDIGHCPMKVKITARLSNFSPFTTIQVLYLSFDTMQEVVIKYMGSSDNNIPQL